MNKKFKNLKYAQVMGLQTRWPGRQTKYRTISLMVPSLDFKSQPVFHLFLKQMKALELEHQTLIVALSGGRDSVGLLLLLVACAPILKIKVVVAHVHHGANGETQTYRQQAWQFSRGLAKYFKLTFLSNYRGNKEFVLRPSRKLTNEAELRAFRYKCLRRMSHSMGNVPVLLAHHRDDLVETTFIRLIRGASAEAFVGMEPKQGFKYRPLLEVSGADIESLLKFSGWPWLEDPSNSDTKALRNWLRNRWLPMLNKKRAGSLDALNRSFLNLRSFVSSQQPLSLGQYLNSDGSLSRQKLQALCGFQRKQVLREFIIENRLSKKITSNQLSEVIKRLDSRKTEHNFKLMGCLWSISPRHIHACRDERPVSTSVDADID